MRRTSSSYLVIMIPQGPEGLPSIEEVKRLYGKPDRVDTTGKDDSYFYGKIILQAKKGSTDLSASARLLTGSWKDLRKRRRSNRIAGR
jgi:hypothetical protein